MSINPQLRSSQAPKGFTLIELLVVIAIIAILSSVVIASLNSARIKARNANRLSQIKEYKTALEFYYDKYGGYPDNTANAVNTWSCLGDYPGTTCWSAGNQNEDAVIATPLAAFISLPAGDTVTGLQGFIYSCKVRNSSNMCTSYDVRWPMEGANNTCGNETVNNPNFNSLGTTLCDMIRP